MASFVDAITSIHSDLLAIKSQFNRIRFRPTSPTVRGALIAIYPTAISNRAKVFCHSISPLGVILSTLTNVLPDRMRPVKLDRIQALNLDAASTSGAFEPQQLTRNL
jgi:hypothetical protein